MAKTKQTIKKQTKEKDNKEEAEEDEEYDYLFPPKQKIDCNHNWHLTRSMENFMTGTIFCTFICDKCGKLKKMEGREEI